MSTCRVCGYGAAGDVCDSCDTHAQLVSALAEIERLRAVLTQVVHETGTSTMAHKIALAALHADKEGEKE